jgi:hypothetical protein
MLYLTTYRCHGQLEWFFSVSSCHLGKESTGPVRGCPRRVVGRMIVVFIIMSRGLVYFFPRHQGRKFFLGGIVAHIYLKT